MDASVILRFCILGIMSYSTGLYILRVMIMYSVMVVLKQYSSVKVRYFGETYWLHIQGSTVNQARNLPKTETRHSSKH
jgi:hypothetical protein